MALLSITVRIALLLLSTMRSISQTPKRLPSVSAGRSCMLTRFFILVALSLSLSSVSSGMSSYGGSYQLASIFFGETIARPL